MSWVADADRSPAAWPRLRLSSQRATGGSTGSFLDPAEGSERGGGERAEGGFAAQLGAGEPPECVDLIVIRLWRTPDDARPEDGADVGALVTVGIGDPKMGSTDGSEDGRQLHLCADLFGGFPVGCIGRAFVHVHRAAGTDGEA